MAPQLQPWPLYRLCLSSASLIVDQGCTNIFLEHGSYGNQDCLDAINDLQNYLISMLPLTVFEHLAEDRNSRTRNHNPLFLWSKDPRIKLGLFLHPNIRKFNVDGKGNELMLMQQHDDFGNSNSGVNGGGLDDFFWCAHIRRLVNLIDLNLNLITTDEILLLIGNYCRKLEVVNIVSRIKQDYIQQEVPSDPAVAAQAGQPQQPPSIFPGITLKFCVSDLGLEALLKCQLLRKITMNKITNHTAMPTNRGITLEGVRRLVKGLPNLEIISFGSMGKIMSSGFDQVTRPLKLIHFNELDPGYVQVESLARLCPHIAHLNLSVPITINSSGNIDANVGPCVSILEALAKSDLPLRIIEFQHFPYCDAFEKLLKAKGHRLQELLFRAINSLSSKHLMFIGEHCRGLQKLHIKELGPEDQDEGPAATNFTSAASIAKRKLFAQLQSVHISGRGWNSRIVLPIVLMSATKIAKLSLMNMSSRMSMDPAWTRILSMNHLEHLTSISLYSGCYVSISLVRKLTLECPKLTFFSFIQSESIELAEVERLRLEVARKNLNIKLCCLEMFDV